MKIAFLSSILITLLFFTSGIHKIKDFMNVSKGFVEKTNVSLFFAKIIISLVILLEIIAPLIITFYSANPSTTNNMFRQYTKISILVLIVFTILATALYHFPPYGANYYSFMSNLSTIGGLLLLLHLLTFKTPNF
jgi:uncharacterized membrane protein YphA (DoxX/SURF4 family)